MKQRFVQWMAGTVLAAGILLTAACSPKHYTETRGGDLSLYFRQAGAEEVIFASSIDQYLYHQASKVQDDLWEVTVSLQDEFDYFYIVDGVVTLPECRLKVNDDFGSKNCLFVSTM